MDLAGILAGAAKFDDGFCRPGKELAKEKKAGKGGDAWPYIGDLAWEGG
jgi:hypothetical protein